MQSHPIAINFVPTGVVPQRAQHPAVPLQPQEIEEAVAQAVEIGITLVHLHARDSEDQPTLDPELYAKLIRRVRSVDERLVVCISLSGRGGVSVDERLAPLELDGDVKPDMASLTLSSLNFSRQASVNAPDTILALAQRMKERSILPELEIFDLGMANVVNYLRRKGLVGTRYYANLLFGNLAGAQATLPGMNSLVSTMPSGGFFAFAGLGQPAHKIASCSAFAFADGLRTGLEDTLFLDEQRLEPATNRELLQRVKALSVAYGRSIMTPTEFRQMLNLQTEPGLYGVASMV